MALFALSDLHLSLSNPDKSMDVFGPSWNNYIERIRDNWTLTVAEDDTVLIAGDISWATYIDKADEDFAFIDSLPGRKLLSRGNHDFWWTTINKMNLHFQEQNFKSMEFVRTNLVRAEGVVISGTRGWDLKPRDEDTKIYERELMRVQLSINEILSADPDHNAVRILMLHYPPLTSENQTTDFTTLIEDAKIDICVYGHLHGNAHRFIYKDELHGGTKYVCAAADYLKFCPVKLV